MAQGETTAVASYGNVFGAQFLWWQTIGVSLLKRVACKQGSDIVEVLPFVVGHSLVAHALSRESKPFITASLQHAVTEVGG